MYAGYPPPTTPGPARRDGSRTDLEGYLLDVIGSDLRPWDLVEQRVEQAAAISLLTALPQHAEVFTRQATVAGPAPGCRCEDRLWALLEFSCGLGGPAEHLARDVLALLPEHDSALV